MFRYNKYLIITGLLIYSFVFSAAQQVYRTEVLRDDVKSLNIKVADELIATPYIELNSDRKIEISFDALFRTGRRFAYSVIHCDADWRQSVLLPIEYLKGFNNISIEDFANSFNTTTNYTNYILTFPNEDTQLITSGNYAVRIYEEDNPDITVLTACFSLTEPLVEINASVTGNTDIDFNSEHQQVDFMIDIKDVGISFPQSDLKIYVWQNNNRQDMRTNLQASIIRDKQLIFSHNRNLIFNAGNEYRRIEFLTHLYNGMGVESTKFFSPFYNVTLFQDKKRNRKSYLYDQDQNGRFFIRCSKCEDPYTEADYYIVHFSLLSEQINDGDVYLYGDFFNNILNEKSRMEYNAETSAYEKSVVLKQGLYNYQYIFADTPESMTFEKTEGNYYETENEYTVAVYYRPAGARYDRLVGIHTFSSNHAPMRARPLP